MLKHAAVCAIIMLLGVQVAQAATTSYLWDSWGGTWSDADKNPATGDGDDKMCWAAAASNVLAWSGWGNVGGMTTTDQMFQYYQDHWTDLGGLPHMGWNWWFDGNYQSEGWSGWSQVDVAGGSFYTTDEFLASCLLSTSTTYAMGNINYLLTNGYGTALGLYTDIDGDGTTEGGHSVTCWGYEYDESTNLYTGLYVTDSDDGLDALRYYGIAYDSTDSAWYLQDFYGTSDIWYIGYEAGLSQMPTVPAPGALLLAGLGTGVVGLMRKKRNQARA